MSADGRFLSDIVPVVVDEIVLPFGSCTFIGAADEVSCKPAASERRRRVCVDPESIQKFPEKAIVLCAKAVLITTDGCKQYSNLFRGSSHIFVTEPPGHVMCDFAERWMLE